MASNCHPFFIFAIRLNPSSFIVMQNIELPILKKLLEDLPGDEAQSKMAPLGRKEYADSIKNYTESAVIILLVPSANGLLFPLIQRSSKNVNDKHAGQISLPGGKKDKTDANLIHTALRELEEEIGIPTKQVEILGSLSPLKVPVSGFIIHPVLGLFQANLSPVYKKQISEVDEILEITLSEFMDDQKVQYKDIKIREGVILKEVPYFHLSSKIVWGATAMILSEMKEILKKYRNCLQEK